MDEKEIVRRTRNSFRAKKTRAEILKGFQKRGYKIEYAEEIISKVERPKKILFVAIICLVFLSSLSISAYFFLSTKKTEMQNPLADFSISGKAISEQQELQVEDIRITPEFISYILNEIGAWKLHKNPFTFEKPIINFEIGSQTFHSEIGKDVKTFIGLSENADIQLSTTKEEFVNALASEVPQDFLKKSLLSGKTQVKTLVTEVELVAKGYYTFYKTLK